ncbi:MAG TPA: isocitrate lyase/phosphoenolpyruvate mutase family protein, partial [Thermoanaerobaculia bacterium]|nr:isocitrate lyase/phosphoenolpyruvate mutase family protein [Thermoanaerobaculia bacterium]
MEISHGERLRRRIAGGGLLPFAGVWDVASALAASRHVDGLLVSSAALASSLHGAADPELVSWSDLVSFVQRVRTVLPDAHLLVDVGSGWDRTRARHILPQLETAGASAILIRGARGGASLAGAIGAALAARRGLLVLAGTPAEGPAETARELEALARSGADALLVSGVSDLAPLRAMAGRLPVPFGAALSGRLAASRRELEEAGVSLLLDETTCLEAAEAGIVSAAAALARPGPEAPAG